jgi:putative ABC transport system permease protein
MLGMVFGVAAVVSMLSIGAGAQQRVLSFIDQLGVRNLIVESREAADMQALQTTRSLSPGLTLRDFRTIAASLTAAEALAARKRLRPSRMLPRPRREIPELLGFPPAYQAIGGLEVTEGRFYDAEEEAAAAPVCVLGAAARSSLFADGEALGEYVKAGEQWLRVIGVAAPRVSLDADTAGLKARDLNNVVYLPLRTVLFRFQDPTIQRGDEIDGIVVQLRSSAEAESASEVIRGILGASHRGVSDYSVIVPSELQAEQQRSRRIFEAVMGALASIALLVGGIGIMNIMLASVLERTNEIGIRRAVGARRSDIVRQFLIEAVLIAVVGGVLGVGVGIVLSRVVALIAGWATIVTPGSVALAFLVSVAVGLASGIYPARQAARLNPVQAIHHE